MNSSSYCSSSLSYFPYFIFLVEGERGRDNDFCVRTELVCIFNI
uniref:Uncharacterized protein n=1 Tax=Anguilla anguilla TaxID=7936 RepID=A0A0E9U1K5_ANGAN